MNLSHSFCRITAPIITVLALTACGGGGGDSTPEPTGPESGTPENPGQIHVGRFEDGTPLTYAQMEDDPDWTKRYSYRGLKDFLSYYINQSNVPYVLFALNGMTIGTGYTVGDVYLPYNTLKTEYNNSDTGDYYTYAEFAIGVYDRSQKLLSLQSHYNGQPSGNNYFSFATRYFVFSHEACHAIDDKLIKNESLRKDVIDLYRADIAQARYEGRLDEIPTYFRLTSDGGMQTTIERASQEVFAEICGAALYGQTQKGRLRGPHNFERYTGNKDIDGIFKNYATHVWNVLEKLGQDYAGRRYAFNMIGADGDGDTPTLLTNPTADKRKSPTEADRLHRPERDGTKLADPNFGL